MAIIKSIFWNQEERRLRVLWRFFVFLMVFVPLLAGTQALIYVLAPSLVQALNEGEGMSFLWGWTLSEWLMVGAILVALWIVGRWIDRRPFSDYGFHFGRRWWMDLLFGMVLGAVLMTGIFLSEYVLGWVTVSGSLQSPAGVSFWQGLLTVILLFLAVGIFEELFSRGYLLHNLAEGLNFKFWNAKIALVAAWVLASLLFGVAHASNPNATTISTINLVLAGLFLGLGYVLTGELAIPVGLHITWNFFQGNVYGFPVSGMSVNQVSFVTIEQGGPGLWTGGAFGPEAGLIGNIAILVGAILVLAWVKWRYGAIRLQERIPLPPHAETDA